MSFGGGFAKTGQHFGPPDKLTFKFGNCLVQLAALRFHLGKTGAGDVVSADQLRLLAAITVI